VRNRVNMAKYALLLALALLSAATSILATPCALRNFKCVNKTVSGVLIAS
jgi:hypothetical protein